MHTSPHPLAGKVVKLGTNAKRHPQFGELAGQEFEVEDWWDRVTGGSWMNANGNPAALIYAVRSGMGGLPVDDKVSYGKLDGMGVLIHESEYDYE